MIWSDLLIFIAGLGVGLITMRWYSMGFRSARSHSTAGNTANSLNFLSTATATATAPEESAAPDSASMDSNSKALQQQMPQFWQSYYRAVEMSQFHAGFLARTSHELRSPINGTIGLQQLILADLCDSPEEEREFLQQAHTSLMKTLGLLDELITVSKVDYGTKPLRLEAVNLAEILAEVKTLTHLQAANRNLRLEIVPPDGDLHVQADRERLQQVLVSLVDGAIAQMDEGHIRIYSRVDSQTDHQNDQQGNSDADGERVHERVHIHIDDQRPAAAWRESVDWLKAQTADAQTPESSRTDHVLDGWHGTATTKTIPAVIQAALADDYPHIRPSMGLGLLMNQMLLHNMGGSLEILATPITASDSLNSTNSTTENSATESATELATGSSQQASQADGWTKLQVNLPRA